MRSWRSAEHGFTPYSRSAQHGFTLIELMVALLVFSLAALALIRLEGATIRGAAIADARLTAQIVARNIAVEALTDARPPTAGETRGTERNGGRNWAWQRNVSAIGGGNALRVDVRVVDSTGTEQGRMTVVRSLLPETEAAP